MSLVATQLSRLGQQNTRRDEEFNEKQLKVLAANGGAHVKVTFGNDSRFLVRQLGEILLHPHKEARPLTRAHKSRDLKLNIQNLNSTS